MDFVITVATQAAREQCPYWPATHDAHWGMPDPAAVTGRGPQAPRFLRNCNTLRRRIELLASLPLEKFDGFAGEAIRISASDDAGAGAWWVKGWNGIAARRRGRLGHHGRAARGGEQRIAPAR